MINTTVLILGALEHGCALYTMVMLFSERNSNTIVLHFSTVVLNFFFKKKTSSFFPYLLVYLRLPVFLLIL